METEPKKKMRKGFAAMSPEKQREIASMGGRSVPPDRRSYSQDRTLASTAGRKGGVNGVGPSKARRGAGARGK